MRAVDADELRNAIEKYRPTSAVKSTFIDGEHCMFMNCIAEIDNAPTVDLTKNQAYDKGFITAMKLYARPQGKWIAKRLGDNTHIWVCSECGNQNTHGITIEKACWKCGAEMKGGKE